MFKKVILSVVVAMSGSADVVLAENSGANCIAADSVIGATYRVHTEAEGKSSDREITVFQIAAGRVMYLMPEDHISQIYERYPHDQVKLIEYFDLEEIGVEHDPNEPQAAKDWSAIYQVYPKSKLGPAEAKAAEGYACLPATQYRHTSSNGSPVNVVYFDGLDLPVKVETENGDVTKRWELEKLLTDKRELEKQLARVEGYRSYDFADLGDSENEEFFRNSRYLQYKLGHEDHHGH